MTYSSGRAPAVPLLFRLEVRHTSTTTTTGWRQAGSTFLTGPYHTVSEGLTTTIGISLFLEDLDGSPLEFDGTITHGFTTFGTDITGWFLYPDNVCGTFCLVFIEHQIYEGEEVIPFRAAAPTISISCSSCLMPVGERVEQRGLMDSTSPEPL